MEDNKTPPGRPPADPDNRGTIPTSFQQSIAIGSGKGGVGKTTVAVNTAVALARKGGRVGLLDADIYGPNVPLMMGIEGLPPQAGGKIIPAESYGVKVISIGLFPGIQADQPLIWRGPMLHKAIQQFIEDVDWGELDYLIIDLPPGTGDAGLSIAQSLALSGGVIVTLPQQVSLDDARRGLEMYRQLNIPVLGVVENMSYLDLPDGSKMDIFGSGGGVQLAQDTGVPFLGQIPIDPIVRMGSDTGRPVVITHPESSVAMALMRATDVLLDELERVKATASGSIEIDLF
jgi:ATP-binding protein involved in chromosome partitioning